MGRFLIASPHSFCDSTIVNRHCDTHAFDASNDIVENLKGHMVVYHPNVSDLRSSGDYNRPETDGAPWREKLKQHASELKPDFMIEVHSFPGDHPQYMNIWNDADLVVFESKYNKKFLHRLVKSLKRSNENIVIHIGRPWHPVSITDDMGSHKHVKRHTLFEFNENRNIDQRKKIAAAVAEAVLDIVENTDIPCMKNIITIASIVIVLILIIFIALDVSSCLFQTRFPVYTYHPGEGLRKPYSI